MFQNSSAVCLCFCACPKIKAAKGKRNGATKNKENKMGGKSKHAENKKICRPFSFSTQDINPELGTLGHILVTAIIFSVSGKKIMAAKIINGQIKRRRLFWADLSCSHFLVALFLRWPKN